MHFCCWNFRLHLNVLVNVYWGGGVYRNMQEQNMVYQKKSVNLKDPRTFIFLNCLFLLMCMDWIKDCVLAVLLNWNSHFCFYCLCFVLHCKSFGCGGLQACCSLLWSVLPLRHCSFAPFSFLRFLAANYSCSCAWSHAWARTWTCLGCMTPLAHVHW